MNIFGYKLNFRNPVVLKPIIKISHINNVIVVFAANKVLFTANQSQIWGKEYKSYSYTGTEEWMKRAYLCAETLGVNQLRYLLTGESS